MVPPIHLGAWSMALMLWLPFELLLLLLLLPGYIKMRILQEPLKEYGILDETSFHVLRSIDGYTMGLFFLNRMHYLMYILGKRENGLQILYYCLKETQHRFPEHGRIVHYLKSKGGRNIATTSL